MRARSWCRVDLAGGTLDIWPLGLLHREACTVSVAIDVEAWVTLTPRSSGYRLLQGQESIECASALELAAHEETALLGLVAVSLELPPVDITVRSDSPRGGGLGASSSIVVAAIAAGEELTGRGESGFAERSALARDLEAQLMGLPTGQQDGLTALLGGALEFRHSPGGEVVSRLDVDLDELAASLVVAYSGQSHFSAGNNWAVVKRRLDGEPAVVEAFDGIAEAAARMSSALEAGDLAAAGELMHRDWTHRRRLAREVSTPMIEELLERGRRAGAWGGKVCGAGGGGCVAMLVPADRRAAVCRELVDVGARLLDTRPAAGPLLVERVES